MKRKLKFDRRGPLAIEPGSFGAWFDLDVTPPPPFEERDGVAIVSVDGPLCQSDGFWFDSYEAITARVSAALESSCSTVLLKIDSPGGETFGCLETSRALRAKAASAGKPLLALITGYGASAAYALACSAERIYALPSALVGSVGVICGLVDCVEANKQSGVRIELVTSGARKADGHPDSAITADAISAMQSQVDALAVQFIGLVAEARGASPEAVTALEAGLFVATQEPSGVRLIDGTATLDELLAMVASGSTSSRPPAGTKDKTMDEEKMLSALRKMAEGDDDNAEVAKAALAKLEAQDEEPKSEDEGEKKDEEKPASEEGSEEEPAKKDEEKPASKAKASKPKSALELRLDAIEKRDQKRERASLLASRPDFDPATVKWLGADTTPLATVRNAVKALPKADKPKTDPKAALTVQATRGSGQTSGDRSAPEVTSEMDRRMGLAPSASPIRREGRNLVLGVMTPEQARAHRAAKEGAK